MTKSREKGGTNMAGGWQMWLALIGGIVAVIGQFWGSMYWLPAIGGILAVIGALGMMGGK